MVKLIVTKIFKAQDLYKRHFSILDFE